MKYVLLVCATLAALAMVVSSSLAQTGAGHLAPLTIGYELTWSTLDGGGAMSNSGGSYSLDGTIGQPEAGVLSRGTFTLNGGFWLPSSYLVYLPAILR